MMSNANWRPVPPGGGGGDGAAGAALDAGGWMAQVPPEARGRVVAKIVETLQRHLPVSGREDLQELNKIALRSEGKIYTAATSQSDYLMKISLKMLTIETKSQSTIPNALPSNPAGNSCEDSVGRGKILKTPPYSSLDRWLRFAIKHDVEELSVTLHYWRRKIYALPQILFCCTTLVKARGDLVKGLLKRLHHVTKLVMGSWCLQVLSLMEAREVFLPSLECRHLILIGAADHEGVPEAIAKILESTRRLEKLFLQMTCTPNSASKFSAESVGRRVFAGEEFWNFVKWRIYHCLMHLRHVDIVDHCANLLAWEPVLSLLKFLLQNALWLDKIVINTTNSELSQAVDPCPLLEVARFFCRTQSVLQARRSFLDILPKDVHLNVCVHPDYFIDDSDFFFSVLYPVIA
ncbi:hypothetical protein NL676_007963 [Syzygium grande]|nr:hypothetical protein NL676_007963 [Syzygium grande]